MRFRRREFLLTASAAVLPAQQKPVTRPNVLIIMPDDLPAWMLGAYGNTEIKTPNIDVLARMGTRFANAFAASPTGSPSRATFYTGRLPRQHGILDFMTVTPSENPPVGQAAPPASFQKEILLSDHLAAAGYECGYVGKWNMGNDAAPGHGYKFTYTVPMTIQGYQDPEMLLNGKPVQESGYLADLVTKRAGEFLQAQSAAKPWLLTVAYMNPHPPYSGHPKKYHDMYADARFDTIGYKPAAPNAFRDKDMLKDTLNNIRGAAAATTALDDQIPVLLSQLRGKGFLENTLIIFTTDNGTLLGRHGLWGTGHASAPVNMFEEVMQVPLFMSWTGRIPAEAVVPEMVGFYDMLPTICEAVGVPPPAGRNLAGRSFYPIAIRGKFPKNQPWRNLVFGHLRNTEMARDTRYKLILRDEGAGPGELYDLRADPREQVNQYANEQYITVRERLSKDLAAWRKRTV